MALLVQNNPFGTLNGLGCPQELTLTSTDLVLTEGATPQYQFSAVFFGLTPNNGDFFLFNGQQIYFTTTAFLANDPRADRQILIDNTFFGGTYGNFINWLTDRLNDCDYNIETDAGTGVTTITALRQESELNLGLDFSEENSSFDQNPWFVGTLHAANQLQTEFQVKVDYVTSNGENVFSELLIPRQLNYCEDDFVDNDADANYRITLNPALALGGRISEQCPDLTTAPITGITELPICQNLTVRLRECYIVEGGTNCGALATLDYENDIFTFTSGVADAGTNTVTYTFSIADIPQNTTAGTDTEVENILQVDLGKFTTGTCFQCDCEPSYDALANIHGVMVLTDRNLDDSIEICADTVYPVHVYFPVNEYIITGSDGTSTILDVTVAGIYSFNVGLTSNFYQVTIARNNLLVSETPDPIVINFKASPDLVCQGSDSCNVIYFLNCLGVYEPIYMDIPYELNFVTDKLTAYVCKECEQQRTFRSRVTKTIKLRTQKFRNTETNRRLLRSFIASSEYKLWSESQQQYFSAVVQSSEGSLEVDGSDITLEVELQLFDYNVALGLPNI